MQPVMQVPLLDLAAQYAPIRDAVVEAVTRVVDTQKFILGPEVEAFEAEAAAYLGARHALRASEAASSRIRARWHAVASLTTTVRTPGSVS